MEKPPISQPERPIIENKSSSWLLIKLISFKAKLFEIFGLSFLTERIIPVSSLINSSLETFDLAFAIIKLLNTSKSKLKEIFRENLPIINVGSGESINIKNLANNISRLVGFEGKINFDKNFPDGTLKKNLNSSKMRKLGWKPNISLKVGLKKIVNNRINEYK